MTRIAPTARFFPSAGRSGPSAAMRGRPPWRWAGHGHVGVDHAPHDRQPRQRHGIHGAGDRDPDGRAPSNAPPTAADGTVRATEDQDYTFTVADFHYTDRDGDALASVTIVTLPASGRGTLTRGEGTVTAGDSVTRTPLAAGTFTYSPPAGATGAGYASFTFTVNDGTDDSASAYTLTIDIAPAAPEPVPALPLLGHLLLALGLAGAGVRVLHRRQRSW